MRYIKKLNVPLFFVNDTRDLLGWKDYTEKKELKKHILTNEQNYLCCYCESKVTISGDKEKDGSHLEHIKPKKFYSDLTFYYNNLLVSCHGTCHNSGNNTTRYSCGHKKDDEYVANKFLNPTIVEDIRDYFKYETLSNEKVKIVPTAKDTIKAQYMINLLHLNDNTLLFARYEALEDFETSQEAMLKEFDLDISVDDIRNMLTEDLAFISFLQYEYGF